MEEAGKIDIWIDRTVAEEPTNDPSGLRRGCAARGFAAGKTSAQAEFTSHERIKSKGVEAAFGGQNEKRDTLEAYLFFGTGSGGRTHTNCFTGT